jgi:hypothetical protein
MFIAVTDRTLFETRESNLRTLALSDNDDLVYSTRLTGKTIKR